VERFEPFSFLHAAALRAMLPWAFVRPARAQ
jgi:hypothetical protein